MYLLTSTGCRSTQSLMGILSAGFQQTASMVPASSAWSAKKTTLALSTTRFATQGQWTWGRASSRDPRWSRPRMSSHPACYFITITPCAPPSTMFSMGLEASISSQIKKPRWACHKGKTRDLSFSTLNLMQTISSWMTITSTFSNYTFRLWSQGNSSISSTDCRPIASDFSTPISTINSTTSNWWPIIPKSMAK